MAQKMIVLTVLILLTAVLLGFLFKSYSSNAAAEKFYATTGNPYQMVDSAPNAGARVAPSLTPTSLSSMSENLPTIKTSQSVADMEKANPDLAGMKGAGPISPSDPFGNEVFNPVTASDGKAASVTPGCFPRDRLTADDLLPKDAANSTWAQVNPAGQGDVSDQNFLNAGYLIGINTIGQSLKNANLQIRSEPANPQMAVSPWNQSTIEPDTLRRPLEVGY